MPHQLCQFHVVKDIVKAVVQAVARERKRLAAQQPTLPRGRPSTQAAKQAARTNKRLAAQRAALFASRYLFVQRHLNKTERKTLWRVSRGLPPLQALRAIMEQVYALCDRRCRTQTASPFNIVIAGRAGRTSTHDRHSRIRCLGAVLLRDRIEIGRGNVSTHVESPAPQGQPFQHRHCWTSWQNIDP